MSVKAVSSEDPRARIARINAMLDSHITAATDQRRLIEVQMATDAAQQRQRDAQVQQGLDTTSQLQARVTARDKDANGALNIATCFASAAFAAFLKVDASKKRAEVGSTPRSAPAGESGGSPAPVAKDEMPGGSKVVQQSTPVVAASPTTTPPAALQAAAPAVPPAPIQTPAPRGQPATLSTELRTLAKDTAVEMIRSFLAEHKAQAAAPTPAPLSSEAPVAAALTTEQMLRQILENQREQQERLGQLELVVARILPESSDVKMSST